MNDNFIQILTKSILLFSYVYLNVKEDEQPIQKGKVLIAGCILALVIDQYSGSSYLAVGVLFILNVLILIQHPSLYRLATGFIVLLTYESVIFFNFHKELIFYACLRLIGTDIIVFIDHIKERTQYRWDLVYHFILFLIAFLSIFYLMVFPLSRNDRMIIFVSVLVITLFYIINGIFIEKILKVRIQLDRQRLQNQIMNREYKILNDKYDEVRAIKHDMRNHLQVILGLPLSEQRQYIDKYLASTDYSLHYVIPDHHVLEVIINEKYQEAKHVGMTFSYESAADLRFIDDIDIVTIFGNLLNNAIEANKQGGFVHTLVKEKDHFIFIEISNSIQIRHKHNHLGVGLKNVKKVIAHYHGQMDVTDENDCFYVQIILTK